MQTNEVQRAWALLPGFLTVADGRPLDLLELGPSAGLNLVWDRYGNRYSTGSWGDGGLELAGNDRLPPPAELLEREVEVVRRRGVDLSPVDVTTEHGARLLQASGPGPTRPTVSTAYGARSRSFAPTRRS